MKRNDKFYKKKKMRKDVKRLDEIREKSHKPVKHFLGWKRRKKVNRAGKKLGIGQDLELLVDTIFIWQHSTDKKTWKTWRSSIYGEKDSWFKEITQKQYEQLPANIQMLLERNHNKNYIEWAGSKENIKWTIAERYEKYLYIKIKKDIRKVNLNRYTFVNAPEEERLVRKLDAEGAWVKLFGDYCSSWKEEIRKTKIKALDKELKRELDLE